MSRLEICCIGVGVILAIYLLEWDHPNEHPIARVVWVSAEAAAGGAAGLIAAGVIDRIRRSR